MPDLLLYGLVVAAALACPAHMWWANRRGKQAVCCPPQRRQAPGDLDALRRRRAEIDAQLAELDSPAPRAPARSAG